MKKILATMLVGATIIGSFIGGMQAEKYLKRNNMPVLEIGYKVFHSSLNENKDKVTVEYDSISMKTGNDTIAYLPVNHLTEAIISAQTPCIFNEDQKEAEKETCSEIENMIAENMISDGFSTKNAKKADVHVAQSIDSHWQKTRYSSYLRAYISFLDDNGSITIIAK